MTIGEMDKLMGADAKFSADPRMIASLKKMEGVFVDGTMRDEMRYVINQELKGNYTMSILEKYNKALEQKDETSLKDNLHDDYKFTMHASGNVLSKEDVIQWAKSDDISREKVRIIYENDEIGVEHSFVTFKDGNTEAVMGVFKFKDGKVISFETGATNMPK